MRTKLVLGSGHIKIILLTAIIVVIAAVVIYFFVGFGGPGEEGKGKKGVTAQTFSIKKETKLKPYHTIFIDGEKVIINDKSRKNFGDIIKKLDKNKEIEISYTKDAKAYIMDRVRFAIQEAKIVIKKEEMVR